MKIFMKLFMKLSEAFTNTIYEKEASLKVRKSFLMRESFLSFEKSF